MSDLPQPQPSQHQPSQPQPSLPDAGRPVVTARLAGRVAVVTGGGNGIGRASALRLAQEGAAVVVADLLDEPAAATVAQIRAAGGQAVACRLDAVSRADNQAMADLAFGNVREHFAGRPALTPVPECAGV